VKSFAWKINTILFFVILQTILYVSFLTLDLTDSSYTISNDIKFSIIILCFCFALFDQRREGRGIIFFIKTGLFFTLISDLFILILDIYFCGVLTFIIVQQLYSIFLSVYMSKNKKEESRYTFLLRFLYRLAGQLGIAFVVCLILQSFNVTLEGLLIASVFYFICILTNVIIALNISLHNIKDKGMLIFAIGMGFFLLCDINVGLFNLSGFISLPEGIYQRTYSVSSILMWTFYAPSQVLIAISTKLKFKGSLSEE
jgi:hypothetical protein